MLRASGATARAVTKGGELLSFCIEGIEYIYPGGSDSYGIVAPVLFPFVSALKDGKTVIEGNEYRMPGRHGFAKDSEFRAISVFGDRITFELCESVETLSVYPYKFRLSITHGIRGGGFSTEYRVENTDGKDILFCIGGHPAFNVPFDGAGDFSDYSLVFPRKVSVPVKDTVFVCDVMRLQHDLFDNGAIIMTDVDFDNVLLINERIGKGFEFSFHGFRVFALWSAPGKNAPFICLEPWLGLGETAEHSGLFADKKYAVTLSPGAVYSAGYGITVI